jgi:hypothetical protein
LVFNRNRIQPNSSISEVASPLKENFHNYGMEEIRFSLGENNRFEKYLKNNNTQILRKSGLGIIKVSKLPKLSIISIDDEVFNHIALKNILKSHLTNYKLTSFYNGMDFISELQ